MTDRPSSSARLPILWAIFVACSWTWCIGLFLPVLLVRDFGLAGWIVFAVPNVVGAAAVGFVRYGRASADPVATNRRAMGWFSVVTIAFHVFFNLWFVPRLLGGAGVALFIVAALGFYMIGRKKPRLDLVSAAAALAISAVAAAIFFTAGSGRPGVPLTCPDPLALALLSPAVVLGFLLCPHLDLTLQRARAETPPARSRSVFVLGFGVFFLGLIAFSLFYAPALAGALAGGPSVSIPAGVAGAIGAHMAIQSGLTVAFHLRALSSPDLRGLGLHLVNASLAAAAVALLILSLGGAIWFGRDAGEVVYRGFMVFYGLAFPAYAWAAWRCRGTGGGPRIAAWLPATVVGLPLMAAAFLFGHPAAAPLAVVLVLVNPWVVREKAQA